MTFTVEFSGSVELQLHEIWPDGDAPENPTAADVVQVMKASTVKHRLLDDWNLEPYVQISVYGDPGDVERWDR